MTRADFDNLEQVCREAAGMQNSPAAGLFDLSPILSCLNSGADLHLDALPTIRRITASGHRWKTWGYAQNAIMEAHGRRTTPAPAVTPTGPPRPAPTSRPKGEGMAALDAYIHELKDRTDDERSERRPNQAPVLRLAASC